jgi:hypothetical protein
VLAYNNAFQSGRSQLVRYRFRLPKDIAGQVSLTATVRYRRFNQHFIDYAITDGTERAEAVSHAHRRHGL